jgi:hypothetical protein
MAGISVSFGDERGTPSTWPEARPQKPPTTSRVCLPGLQARVPRDVVGGVNQNSKVRGLAEITVADESRITYLRP